MAPRVPILAYHAMQVSGMAYETNDHVAFAADLETIFGMGLRVCGLAQLVQALESDQLEQLSGCVALTVDDGSDFDFVDLDHPTWGIQRSIFAILREAGRRHPGVEATSFVIVSPEARAELDRNVMIGKGWWRDEWWAAADASGLLRIESHSWDHNHDRLAVTASSAPKGAFDLALAHEADAQIRDANAHLCDRRGRVGPTLFAYPYGRASDFLARDYFPQGTARHGVRAAFTTDGCPASRGTSPWEIPRYVFGWHWKEPSELERILRECAR